MPYNQRIVCIAHLRLEFGEADCEAYPHQSCSTWAECQIPLETGNFLGSTTSRNEVQILAEPFGGEQ